MSTDNTSTAPEMVECAWKNCDTKFVPIPRTKRYCSTQHQMYAYRARNAATNIAEGLTSKGTERQRTINTVSHTWVADRTGFSKSGVALMRKPGVRDATINVRRFEKFAAAFGWPVADQIAAAADGKWAEKLEVVLIDAYNKENQK